MAFVVKDRVKETTTTTGTSDLVLSGSVSGFQSFSNALADGDTTYYALFEVSTNEWEVGVGTWTESTTTLARTTVLASSNSGSKVSLTAQAEVFISQPAGKAAFFDPSGDLTLVQDPTSNLQAATKQYVDTIAAAGLHYHDPVRVEKEGNLSATYSNGTAGVGATLTNNSTQAALTIDGVALSLNDRVLIYEQTNGYENGVYTVTNVGSASTNWVLTRATDADSYGPSDPDSLGQGDAFFVLEGTAGAGELYVMNTEGTITFGTTNITFTQVAATAVYSAGTGLTLTGTEFAADGANITNVDAVTLDGIDSSQFLRSDVADTKTAGNLNFSDNVKAIFGDGSDLQIYHDGSNSYVSDSGTGALHLRSASGGVKVVDSTNAVKFTVAVGTGDVSVTGLVDGRDIAADGTKLDGIEIGATADQTKADIDALNIDADTVDSLHASSFLRSDADDTTSGVITFTDTGTSPKLFLSGNGGASSYNYIIKGSNDVGTGAVHFINGSTRTTDGGASTYTIRNDIGPIRLGRTSQSTLIEGSGDLTYNSNEVWHSGNDGSGSGLDADTVDGIQASSFLRSDANDTASGDITFNGFVTFDNDASPAVKIISDDFAEGLEIHRNHASNAAAIKFSNTSGQQGILYSNSSGEIVWRPLATTNAYAIWHSGNDGSGSGLDADLLDGQQGSYYLNTSTTFGGDVSGTYDAIVVANDSHNHQFNNLTNKTSGTGEYSTSSNLTSGRGSGGVSLTINDGGGNANVTFNHKGRTPEQNGQAARIEVNTDNTVSGNAHMYFELGGATSGVASDLPVIFELGEDDVIARKPLEVVGDITVSGTVDGVDIAGSINQAVTTTSSPTFADVTATSFSGDGSNLTNVAASTVLVNESTDDSANYNVLFSTTTGAAGVQMAPVTDDGGLTFNPGTNRLGVENIYLGNALVHTSDTDTYFQFHNTSNQARIVCGGAEVMEWGNNYAKMNDNDSLYFGSGSDFRLYHNGTNNFIKNQNHAAGDIYIQGEDTSGVNHNIAAFYSSNAAPYAGLYYDGTEVFKTISGGVQVTGQATMTGGADVTNNQYIGWGGGSGRPAIGGDKTTGTLIFYAGGTNTMNMTSSGLTINNGFFSEAAVAEDYDALSGTTPTCNVSQGGAFSLTMTGNTTFTFSGATSGYGQGFVLQLTGNGSTVTWPTSVDWAGGTAPDAPASGETDIYVFWTRDGGTTWYGVLSVDAAA